MLLKKKCVPDFTVFKTYRIMHSSAGVLKETILQSLSRYIYKDYTMLSIS